jgi:protein-S-isoprenylcysteine O-methyltransferase Ste14
MIASLMALNRSVGVVAANRGIKTRGPYAWIRHPLYAGEILFDLSFLISNWSYANGVLILAITLAQVVRSLQEERLLLRDKRYVLYHAEVPYRLVPGVF